MTQEQEVIYRLRGEIDPSVQLVYGQAEAYAEAETRERLAGLRERRDALDAELAKVSAGSMDYRRLGNAVDAVDRQIEQVTHTLGESASISREETQSRLAGLRQRRAALAAEQRAVETGSRDYIALGRAIDGVDRQIARVTGQVQTFTQRMDALDRGINSANSQLIEQRAQLESQARATRSGTDEYRRLAQGIAGIDRQLVRSNHTLNAQRRTLVRQLRATQEGTQEYRAFRSELAQVDRQLGQNNAVLRRQTGLLERNNAELRNQSAQLGSIVGILGGARNAALGLAGAAGLGAAVIAMDRLGESATRTLAIADSLALPTDFILQTNRLADLVGRDLDFGDYNEFAIRIGELQNQIFRNELDGGQFQRFQEALAPLGLDIRTISTQDLPALLRGIRQLPEELQAFALDEILGGQFAEVVRQIDTLPEEIRTRFETSAVATRGQLAAARDLRTATGLLRGELGVTALSVGVELLPVLIDGIELFNAFLLGSKELIQDAPLLTAAVGGLSGALLIFAARARIAAISQAALLALSGPSGWAILGASVAAAAAAGIAIDRGLSIQQQRAEEAAQTDYEAEKIALATGEAVRDTNEALIDQFKANSESALRNILPAAECAAREAVADSMDAGAGEPEPMPIFVAVDTGPDSSEQARFGATEPSILRPVIEDVPTIDDISTAVGARLEAARRASLEAQLGLDPGIRTSGTFVPNEYGLDNAELARLGRAQPFVPGNSLPFAQDFARALEGALQDVNLQGFERNNLIRLFTEEQARRGLTPLQAQQERPLIEDQLRSTESAIELFRLIREGETNAANEIRVTIPEALQPTPASNETTSLLREISGKLGAGQERDVRFQQTNTFNGIADADLTQTSQDLEAAARRTMLGV